MSTFLPRWLSPTPAPGQPCMVQQQQWTDRPPPQRRRPLASDRETPLPRTCLESALDFRIFSDCLGPRQSQSEEAAGQSREIKACTLYPEYQEGRPLGAGKCHGDHGGEEAQESGLDVLAVKSWASLRSWVCMGVPGSQTDAGRHNMRWVPKRSWQPS